MTRFWETLDFGPNVKTARQTDDGMVLEISDASGDGTMTVHEIFDGAYIMYNDMHLSLCDTWFQSAHAGPVLAIDHCREGRIEQEMGHDVYFYLQEHDMRIDNRTNHTGRFSFPLNHYHGLTIAFDVETAIPALKHFFGGFSVDLHALQKKYCEGRRPFVLRGDPGIEHIFSELYRVPQQIKADYYKVKALELLLYLDALQISENQEERPYFYKSQVEKIKAIHQLITGDLQARYTLEELASQFQISLTSMKTCFKGIYGDSIYSYLKRYRMNVAATMLKQHADQSVAEIAGAVGYESPSKFATAFRQVMGQSPTEYRKSFF